MSRIERYCKYRAHDLRWTELIEVRRPGGRKRDKEKRRTKCGWMMGGGIKYVRRVAGKEILITGMCIRVWPKQIHCQTSCFE